MKFKHVLLASLLLTSCGAKVSTSSSLVASSIISSSSFFNPYNYIKFVEFNDITQKVENKEDFLLIIASRGCGHCQAQERDLFNFMHLNPTTIYIHQVDYILDGVSDVNGEEYQDSKEKYLYFSNLIRQVYNVQNEGKEYLDEYSTSRFGGSDPMLVYPMTFMFVNGTLNEYFSYMGYGWSASEESFNNYLSIYNSFCD